MPKKIGRPPLTAEERDERRAARNEAERDKRAARRERGEGAPQRAWREEREERAPARAPWKMFLAGVIVCLIIGLVISFRRRKSADVPAEPLSAGDIEVSRLDGKKETLDQWSKAVAIHAGNNFRQMNADHEELAQRVNATERAIAELKRGSET